MIYEYDEAIYNFMRDAVNSSYQPKLENGDVCHLLPQTVSSAGCHAVVYGQTPGEVKQDDYWLDLNAFISDPKAWRGVGQVRGWSKYGEWEFKKRMHLFFEARCFGRSIENALKLVE